MLRLVVAILLSICISWGVSADKDKEKSIEALNVVTELVVQHSGENNPVTLKKLSTDIERAWREFGKYYPDDHILMARFSLLRARSLYASGKLQKAVAAWQFALQSQPPGTEPSIRIQLLTEAASASTEAGSFEKAAEYFAASRAVAVQRGKEVAHSQLYLRLKELDTIGQGLEWRRLNDALLDLRKFSQQFVIWSSPRLDALLGEAELRFQLQPNTDEKRLDLAALKAQIELSQKGLGDNIGPMQLERLRTLFYALEDHWQL
ncbi:hypothetical protein [Kordiimonas laminariae]|uniref:hypothetical protein n=1 Tax=Kordiimonas laminariae TaxID=2917717 RepID=UPI001FF30033|nr:hypothetical protein [Kordiimonas laminariae]MCK0071037.1 hypothetical protein [Kordiimonas laminariae]